MECLRTLLICPNSEDAMEEKIGRQYRENRSEFNAMAKNWTDQHATPRQSYLKCTHVKDF